MSSKPNDPRPLSPYMFGSLYRWQISSITSTLHRLTGIALFFSFTLICLWLVGLAAGGFWFGLSQALVNSWFGKLVMFLSLWAMWYHFLNGIRHLTWDLGRGFDLGVARRSGYFVIIGSVVMTILTALMI